MEDLKMIDRLESRRFVRKLITFGGATLSLTLVGVVVGEMFSPSQIERCANSCAKHNLTFTWSAKARTPAQQPDIPERCECRQPSEARAEKVEQPKVDQPVMIRTNESGTFIYSVKP